jgi:hypothetical protein
MTSTLLIASLVDFFNKTTVNRFSFRGSSYKDYKKYMDLNGMQMDRPQYININKNLNNLTKLYLSVYNFDPAYPLPNPRIADLSV